ncbi:hypothetical protein [Demequina flava]|uniref:hypothetical protein n=1 Tax=Demequina flava TaxID=1095025 RepID=UPI000ADB549D|nr:hypothetical protein [Demequina flava]
MTLRTAALAAGVLGVLLLIAGLIADAQRPPRDVLATADVDTPVVVYSPAMVEFAAQSRLGVTGEGDIVALTARPADADAWLAEHEATEVTGLPQWETLSTTAYEAVEPEPTASPSASPSASASASEEPSPSPSPSGDDEAAEDAEPVDILAETSADHWREQWNGVDRVAVSAADVPVGETLIIASRDGSPLTQTDMRLSREVNDGWITPLIWWGAGLTLVGLIALIFRFIDTRPVQAKLEARRASRGADADETSEPGSRRARRENGELLPDASLDEEPASPSSATSTESAKSTDSAASAETPPSPERSPEDEGGRS